MAKKKKTTNSSSSDSIAYTGEVTIKVIGKNGKVRRIEKHNTGTIALFTFLTKALKGDTASKYRPQTIMAFGDTSGNSPCFANKIPYTGTPQLYYGDNKSDGSDASTNGSNGVVFTFTVPFSNISGSKSIKMLRFYNTMSSGDVCAEVNLSNEIELDNISNIVVYWKMSFSSVSTNE